MGAYLLGSIPFGLLIARTRRIDIRTVGSCNIGATNVWRCVGKGWGLLTFACDVLKGFIPAFFLPALTCGAGGASDRVGLGLLYGALAIVGHNWPVFLRFKGGKGVATTVGALLGVAPALVGIGFVAWLLIFLATGYVSLASIVAAVVIPGIAWWPGKIASGSISQHPAYFGDFMATAAEISGGSTPKNIQSISFLPTLLGKQKQQQKPSS